jgi:hypothetical protein
MAFFRLFVNVGEHQRRRKSIQNIEKFGYTVSACLQTASHQGGWIKSVESCRLMTFNIQRVYIAITI